MEFGRRRTPHSPSGASTARNDARSYRYTEGGPQRDEDALDVNTLWVRNKPPVSAIVQHLKVDLRHRITNATSESMNAKIQWVKFTARGFRNRQNFVHAIYFHCGGLDLTPESTQRNKTLSTGCMAARTDAIRSRPAKQ